jgi:hypothetical protein
MFTAVLFWSAASDNCKVASTIDKTLDVRPL